MNAQVDEFKIELKRSELVRALDVVCGALESRTTMPVLGCVCIECDGLSVTLTVTDIEMFIRYRIDNIQARPGSVVLEAKRLHDYVRLLSSESVTLKALPDYWVSVSAGKSRTKIPGYQFNAFPEMPNVVPDSWSEVDPESLSNAIHAAMFCCPKKDGLKIVNGGMLKFGENSHVVCADVHRMSYRSFQSSGVGGSFLLHRRALGEFKRLLDKCGEASVGLTERFLSLKANQVYMLAKRMQTSFPGYQAVIALQCDPLCSVDGTELAAAVRRALSVSGDTSAGFYFNIADGVMSFENPDATANEQIEVMNFHGEPKSIRYNPNYLLEYLLAIKPEKIDLSLGPRNTLFIRDGESGGIYSVASIG